MLPLLMRGLKEEDGPRRSSLNSCNTDIFFSNYYHLLSVRFELRIAFVRKLRDVTCEQASARAKVTRVELRIKCLFEVDSETELARAWQTFYPIIIVIIIIIIIIIIMMMIILIIMIITVFDWFHACRMKMSLWKAEKLQPWREDGAFARRKR